MKKILFLILLSFTFSTHAVDGVSVEAGTGNAGVHMARVGAQWDWQRQWFDDGAWRLGGYWDASVGAWNGGPNTVWDYGFTPTFRYERAAGGSPYLEAAIGFHYLSNAHISSTRDFSTRFQFGDHVGVGVRFGPGGRYDLGLRLQHLSNAGIRDPNPGINFLQARFQYHFR
ncbi:MAG TPA: acyloxyacyl hydrolase [Burkholderiales bacterium]